MKYIDTKAYQKKEKRTGAMLQNFEESLQLTLLSSEQLQNKIAFIIQKKYN